MRKGGREWGSGWGALAMAAAALVGISVLVGAPARANGQERRAPASAGALKEAKELDREVMTLYGEKKFDDARRVAKRAHALREQVLGPGHPDVATSLTSLAFLHPDPKDYAENELLLRRALAIWEKVRGPESTEAAYALDSLALLYQSGGDHAQAEPLLRRALAIGEKVGGPESMQAANALDSLAGLYKAMKDYTQAEPLLRRAVVIRTKLLGPEHIGMALYLNELAGLYQSKGDYAQAEPLYRRALAIREKALGPEDRAVALSLNDLASMFSAKGDHDQAESLYRRALAIVENERWSEDPDVAFSLNRLALTLDKRGDHTKAEPLYRRALAILEKVRGPEHLDLITSLDGLAVISREKGDHRRAAQLYQRALAIREKELGPENLSLAFSLSNLGSLHLDRGDYARAEPLFRRALAISEKALDPEHRLVAACLHSLGLLYAKTGDTAQAERMDRRALAILTKTLGPEHPGVAMTLNNLAVLYNNRGSAALAEMLHRHALAIQEKTLGPEHPDIARSLNNLAVVYFQKGSFAQAEPLYRRALAIREKVLGPQDASLATSLDSIGLLHCMTGDCAQAEPLYRRALAIREKALGPMHPMVANSLHSLAYLHLVMGTPDEALQNEMQAIAVEDHNTSAMLMTGADEQKVAYMATLTNSTYQAISLHTQSAHANPRAKQLALTTILQRKGRALEAMAQSFAALRRRSAPAEQVKLDRMRSLTAEYSALVWRGPGTSPLGEYRTTLARLNEERRDLEDDLSRRSVGLQVELRPVDIEKVQAALPAEAVLVEMFRYSPFNPKARKPDEIWGKARYVAYVLRRGGGIQWTDLGKAALIETAVDAFLMTLRRPGADPKPSARALDALVMQPIRRLLGESRWVFLSPDGPLNLVPFAALRDENGDYLVERYAFTYLTSGRELLRLAATAPSHQRPVILAAPDFGAASRPASAPASDDSGQRSADMGARSFGPLPSAAEEGRALGQKLPEAQLLMGADATESAVKAMRSPRLLHIATHGFFLPDQPEQRASFFGEMSSGSQELNGRMRPALYAENPLLRAGLVFAGVNQGGSGTDDGVLTAFEVAQLDLSGTKLVVLSACETGVGEAKSGEGVYGLRRALFIAGAETQVMSLWKVNDAAAREQMEAYYGNLLQGGGRSEAMRQVQLAMLKGPQRAHPYYWASFIVSGNPAALDGTTVVPKLAQVTPGPRGCGCEVGARTFYESAAWPLGLAALGVLRARRRASERLRRAVSAGWHSGI